jgi:hypothetical protein
MAVTRGFRCAAWVWPGTRASSTSTAPCWTSTATQAYVGGPRRSWLLHFLRWGNSQSVEISNYFKYIANEFPVTIIYIGVDLDKRGLFSAGEGYSDAVMAQTGRRTTRLGMEPFHVKTKSAREQWRQLLLSIEQRIVLADSYRGMLVNDLSDYLFARSTGNMGSLMTLLNRGCQRAIRTGAELLTTELLDRVKIDHAAEKARRELESAMKAGKLTSRNDRS